MNGKEVREIVRGLPAGTTLKLVYKMDAEQDVLYLKGMMDSRIIENDPELLAQVREVLYSGTWGKGENPNHVSVKTTAKFNIEWFINRVAYVVESITVEEPVPEKASLIAGPEEATYSAQAELFDASDPTLSLGVSVNVGETNTYSDFWVRDFGTWRRVSKLQKVIEGEVDEKRGYELLIGEINHAVFHPEIGLKISEDMRLSLGIKMLRAQILSKLS